MLRPMTMRLRISNVVDEYDLFTRLNHPDLTLFLWSLVPHRPKDIMLQRCLLNLDFYLQ